jgi:hypothetical protein
MKQRRRTPVKLSVAFTWNGRRLKPAETSVVECRLENEDLTVLVDAPFFDDPPPSGRARSTDHLWEYEVVELFLVGEASHYLEVELAPRGHYFVLQLHGARNVVRKGLRIRYEAEISGHRWHGIATVPRSYLPPGIERANAYAMHGTGQARRYLAAFPVPGAAPDFHRLEAFGKIAWPPSEPPSTVSRPGSLPSD